MEIETSKLHLSFREPKEYSKPLLPITEEKNTAKQSDSYFDEKKKQENDIRDSLSLI